MMVGLSRPRRGTDTPSVGRSRTSPPPRDIHPVRCLLASVLLSLCGVKLSMILSSNRVRDVRLAIPIDVSGTRSSPRR